MILILDTSAAVSIALNSKGEDGVVQSLKKAEWVIAPDLFISETTNVCWKYHHHEDLPMELCEELLEKTIALVDDFSATKDLFKEAFSLACMTGHPVYDMMYLTLSRRHNGTLATKDKKLTKIAKKYSVKVIW